MPFNVKDPAEVSGLQTGDKITFRLSVTGTDAWIDEIKNTGERVVIPKPVAPEPMNFVQELEPDPCCRTVFSPINPGGPSIWVNSRAARFRSRFSFRAARCRRFVR